jgi:hypothetical protein
LIRRTFYLFAEVLLWSLRENYYREVQVFFGVLLIFLDF